MRTLLLLATLLISLLLWADALHDDGDEIPDGFGLDDFAPEAIRAPRFNNEGRK